MTPAEFKTAHECLGLSTEFIAREVGVSVGRIWAYEHPTRTVDVPERAAETMLDLVVARETAIQRVAEEILAEGEAEVIPRHSNLDAFHKWVPELKGWGALAQGLFLAELQNRLRLPLEYVL